MSAADDDAMGDWLWETTCGIGHWLAANRQANLPLPNLLEEPARMNAALRDVAGVLLGTTKSACVVSAELGFGEYAEYSLVDALLWLEVERCPVCGKWTKSVGIADLGSCGCVAALKAAGMEVKDV